MWSVKQLEELKIFGIDTDKLNIIEINAEIIKKLHLFASVAEYNEKEQFQKEIKRLLKPNN
jgi:hypothetical protein